MFEWFRTEGVQLLMAFTGSAGFAILFQTKRSRIIPAAFGGLLSWGIYLLLLHLTGMYFAACVIAAAAAAVYSEVMARVEKTPTTVFFISAVIPLIPGSSLYYTVSNMVAGNRELAESYGVKTILYMVGIAVGVSLVNTFIIARGKYEKTMNRER